MHLKEEKNMPLAQLQATNACGVTSLSSALFAVGIDVSPRRLSWSTGHPWRVFMRGSDENELARLARKFGASARFHKRLQRPKFCSEVRGMLRRGSTVILCVWDFRHWVSVVGYKDGQFLVMDPLRGRIKKWTAYRLDVESWCEDEDGDEPSQHFAIEIRRK